MEILRGSKHIKPLFCTFMAMLITFALLVPLSPAAASDDYRFTHNDQDLLLLGEITGITDEQIELKPIYYIVSTSRSFESDQLRPKKVFVARGKWLNDSIEKSPEYYKAGAHLIASLDLLLTEEQIENQDRSGNVFTNKWGIFPVSGTDKNTMEFLTPIDSYREDFLRSGFIYTKDLDEYIAAHEVLSAINPEKYSVAVYYPASKEYAPPAKPFEIGTDGLYAIFTLILIFASVLITYLLTKRKYTKE